VKTLKGQEDLIPILGVNPDAIVSHRETPSIAFPLSRYMHAGRFFTAVQQRVIEQGTK
jgi:hypothetical protein